jgi:hypothetical protein
VEAEGTLMRQGFERGETGESRCAEVNAVEQTHDKVHPIA